MSKSRPYAAVPVNSVALDQLIRGRGTAPLVVGFDIGKHDILAAPRWGPRDFGRPWRIPNPTGLPQLLRLLASLAQSRPLTLALEPSGTYGDALRQACHDAGLPLLQVSPKAAHDYAEIFDGTPSQHDGKDAAVVAELAALGKASPWPYREAPTWEQQLRDRVEWLETQRQLLVIWAGRLEALLARHWPEATRVLRLTRPTLLRALMHYGGPAALAADPQAPARLQRWGGVRLGADKVRRLLEAARTSAGVRQNDLQRRQLRRYARRLWRARLQVQRSRRALARLVGHEPVLQAQARAVGGATACVLWACVGDPRVYSCGAAYRKALGLNLTEYSSGTQRGELHISKRGAAAARRWLYLAALRLTRQGGVRRWYRAKQERDGRQAKKRALVGVMRKLALALYRVGAQGATFQAERLFPGQPTEAVPPEAAERP